MSGTQTAPIIRNDGSPLAGGGALTSHQEINWFGTLRPRFGYTVTPSMLVYGTGGLAYGDVSYSANTDFRPAFTAFYPASVSKTKVGWTVGAGVEYAIAKNWTVKTEYLYMDLGDQSAIGSSIGAAPFQVGYNWETTAHIVNVGMNYKF
jgi:outer membrane immunogenic protein